MFTLCMHKHNKDTKKAPWEHSTACVFEHKLSITLHFNNTETGKHSTFVFRQKNPAAINEGLVAFKGSGHEGITITSW